MREIILQVLRQWLPKWTFDDVGLADAIYDKLKDNLVNHGGGADDTGGFYPIILKK